MFYLEIVALSVFGKLDFKIRVFFQAREDEGKHSK